MKKPMKFAVDIKKLLQHTKFLENKLGNGDISKIFTRAMGNISKFHATWIMREESMDYMCPQYTHHIWRLWYDIVLLGQNGVT